MLVTEGVMNMKGLTSQLSKLNVQNLKTRSGLTYGEILKGEADRLRGCIQHRLDIYLASYMPKVYKRTHFPAPNASSRTDLSCFPLP